jgi:hypothetical protein
VQFLHKNANGEVRFDEYFEYIESIRDKLSAEAHQFASNFEHYSLQGKASLHDACIQRIEIEESASGVRSEVRELGMRMQLLGPYHDRTLLISYDKVSMYAIGARCGVSQPVAHGDIFTHEVRISEDQQIVHEVFFTSGSTFCVTCRNIRFETSMLSV